MINRKNLTSIAATVAGSAQSKATKPSSRQRRMGQTPRTVSAEPRVSEVLVPIDFSEGSRLSLRYAAPLARRLGATITLIYVDPPPFLAADLYQQSGALAGQVGGRLSLSHVIELSGLHVSVAVRQLRMAPAQYRVEAEEKLAAWAAEQVPPSVLIARWKSCAPARRTLSRTTTRAVMTQSRRPVLAVRPPAE